ncbi:crossover junction endonuclease EME1 [Crotalus tigris]|uniref:crossover junction endonuclease EME1 n=1 Tax=Crotalus tigris TaxID=88082 RepID=UPI00192F2E04|nr:crossover junction endonuclease EME1 [Crotalus tigris]XP_039198793.1 crossover junction endonuclease EME1 [Crotalus tigris]XP_039198794.1 crossover junction endonuclease EME1 [Crotalus tigris]
MELNIMFSEPDESDCEELPVFFPVNKPPDPKNSIRPSPDNPVVVLSSSDSEDSFLCSPARKKPHGPCNSVKMAASTDVRLQLISESEEEEEIFVPLAERLRRKLLVARLSTTAPSFTRIQTKSGRRPPVSDEELMPTCWQEPLPADSDLQENVAPNAWELSDSDQEVSSWNAKPQSSPQLPICISDNKMLDGTHQISLKSFPLQTSTRHNHQDLDKVCQAVLQKSKEQGGQKQLQEREKQRKVALAQLRKAQRPEQCLKHIQIVLDPGLLQINGADEILVALQSMESNYAIESQAVPCSITWRRKTGLTEAEEDNWIEEPNVLVPMLLPDFIAMIHNSKQARLEGPTETLQSFVAKITEKIPGKTLSLAVTELEKHFSSQKPKSQKKLQQAEQSSSKAQEEGKPRKRKEKTNPVSQLSRLDVEEALVELQLHTGVQVQVLASWKEFGEFASMFTKAVAEAPFKKEKNKTSFSFCLEGDWCRGVKVDRAGKGLLQVWKRQIQQYNRVSLEMASAIVARYPSPQLLMQAYDSHASEQERQHLLAEVPVRRGDGVTTTTRRVGPDLSKRIYLQMTSHNPDLSLDVTG